MKRVSLCVPLSERVLVGLVALVATYAFFCEYLPPFHSVHIFSDIQGYHYPLQRYAFDALKQHRFPQWDPSIYSGIPFVGNVQAAVLYPPNWLMYGASWGMRVLPFRALEIMAALHVWLGFLLCYLWLRARGMAKLAGVLGAAVFAYGGYMVSQMVHVGVENGLAWMPLGLWGIDEAADREDWRPLWKTAAASAMCFLAGYPASWLVFSVTCFLYALGSRARGRAAVGVLAAAAASVLLAAAQWLPTLEARASMMYGEKYGGGAAHWSALIPFFVPNWFDFNSGSPRPYPDAMYLYLGTAAIFALGWGMARRRWRPYGQALVPLAVLLVLATNPAGLVYRAMVKFPALESVAQSYNFYEGVAGMAALITAIAVNDFLGRRGRRAPRWALPAMAAALALWGIGEALVWWQGGRFPIGIRALSLTAAGVALTAAALWVVRGETGRRRVFLAAALVLAIGADYKAFGTNRRFNTAEGNPDEEELRPGVAGISDAVYQVLLANRDYRVACDEEAAPYSTDLRRWGLATPQGFDPFLPARYRQRIERWVKFKTNRLFFVDFTNADMMRTLGIRYVITHEGAGHQPMLAKSPDYRLVGGKDAYYLVYEYLRARAPYGWVEGEGEARASRWLPERRELHVFSPRGGRFYFAEQFFPGWYAKVDGRPVPIQRWNGTYQAIDVGPGIHGVLFQYRSRYLKPGALISVLAWAGLAAVIISERRRRRPQVRRPPAWEFRLEVRAGLARPA
jgi:hypothetical protein